MRGLKDFFTIIIITVLLLSFLGCKKTKTEDSEVVEDQPSANQFMDSNSMIILYTGAQSIIADSNTSLFIFAEIKNSSGDIIADGSEVTISTTAGDINPMEEGDQNSVIVETKNAIAKTTLTSSTTSETATITVSIGNITAYTTADFIAGPPGSLVIEASPSDLSADGISQTTIAVTVLDGNNNLVADGTLVTCDAEEGNVSSHVANTTMGKVEVTYTAPQSYPASGKDTITVHTSGEVAGSIDITLTESSEDPEIPEKVGDISSISISTGAQNIFADGTTTILVYAEIKDSSGVAIADDTEVLFTTTAGDIDPVAPGMQDALIIQTAKGIACASLTSPTNPGRATITVSTGGTIADTTVNFIAGPPSTLTLEAIPVDLIADGKSQSAITAMVLDAYNNPVADGTIIIFDPIEGSLSSHIAYTTTGVASVSYTVPHFQLPSGFEIISARTTNGTTDSVTIKLRGPQIAGIVLKADPETLPADGTSITTIKAHVSFEGGENVPDGTLVDFAIIKGGGSFEGNTIITIMTVQGIAEAKLTSGTSEEIATIQASSGGRVAEIDVSYIPGSVSLAVTPNSLLGTGNEVAKVIATLSTVSGTPPPDGETVTFTLSDDSYGYFTDVDGQNITDSEGIAGKTISEGSAIVLFHASTEEGTVIITATWTASAFKISGSTAITIQPPPSDIQLAQGFPNPSVLNVKGTGGAATSHVTYNVLDYKGNPVSNGYRIDFSILDGPNGGELVIPSSSRTANGKATTILRSGFKSGPVSIKAAYHNDNRINTSSSIISINAGPPVGEEFGIAANYLNIAGFWQAYLQDEITVGIGDVYGNAVPDNTAVAFKTYNTGGFFEQGGPVTDNGLASSLLISSPSPKPLQGFVSVTAETINGGKTTRVTSLAVTRCLDCPDNDIIIYAGTNGGGVYKSLDGGSSWKNISRSSNEINWGQNWIDPYINDIAVDPDCHNTVYAATGYLGKGNVYRSLDGGLNWNSNNVEEWSGIFSTEQNGQSVHAILCDGDEDPDTPNYPYVWVGTNGLGALYAADGKNFKWGGIVYVDPNRYTTVEDGDSTNIYFNPNPGDKGGMTMPILSSYSKTEEWTVIYDSNSYSWEVKGSVSDRQYARAYTKSVYQSDNKEVSFTIESGTTSFTQGDKFEFEVTESGLGYGKTVRDIVKVPDDKHGEKATLYAATPYGVFRSKEKDGDGCGGGKIWKRLTSFTGNSISTLEIHPESDGTTDIIYAGTEDAGVWASMDSGETWTRYSDGISKGISVSIPLPAPDNYGTGLMKEVAVGPIAKTEKWIVTYKGEGLFSVSSGISGPQEDAKSGMPYTSDDGAVSFTIFRGSLDFEIGDSFSFNTTRDTGSNIKDLLVDAKNNKLYALTYFWGDVEPHAVGNVYVHDLTTDLTDTGAMKEDSAWQEQNSGLPLYDPPNDLSLCAQYVLAFDDPNDPSRMYVGGEGINLYCSKVPSQLSWRESKTGLTNYLMARMPVLFSGECFMDVRDNSCPDGDTSFTVYIQDINGNPPVAGSRFSAIHYIYRPHPDTPIINELKTKVYNDTYSEEGTFRDPADAKTNSPYVFKVKLGTGVEDKVIFTFTPGDSTYPMPPGSSGDEYREEYEYSDPNS